MYTCNNFGNAATLLPQKFLTADLKPLQLLYLQVPSINTRNYGSTQQNTAAYSLMFNLLLCTSVLDKPFIIHFLWVYIRMFVYRNYRNSLHALFFPLRFLTTVQPCLMANLSNRVTLLLWLLFLAAWQNSHTFSFKKTLVGHPLIWPISFCSIHVGDHINGVPF